MRLAAMPFKLIDGRKLRATVLTMQPAYSLLRDGPLRIISRRVFLLVVPIKLLARSKFTPACLTFELPISHIWLLSALPIGFLHGAGRWSAKRTQTARGLLPSSIRALFADCVPLIFIWHPQPGSPRSAGFQPAKRRSSVYARTSAQAPRA
jgi:hypothetical protein